MTSPSFTMYSLPSNLTNHFSFALLREPVEMISLYDTISALINHFSKSVWMAPAACGAVDPIGIVHDLVSSSPVVK